MAHLNEKILATQMLQSYETGGPKFGVFLRRNFKRYLITTSYFMIALGMVAFAQVWPAFFTLLGLVAGAYLRDLGWFRMVRKVWPFTLKITDWEKVKKLAEEEPIKGEI